MSIILSDTFWKIFHRFKCFASLGGMMNVDVENWMFARFNAFQYFQTEFSLIQCFNSSGVSRILNVGLGGSMVPKIWDQHYKMWVR